MAKLGFTGPGIMGAPMAANLLPGAHQLFVHGRSSVPPALIEAGATRCASAREVAEHSQFIFTMVPDTPDVERELMNTCAANGESKLDHSALCQAVELMSNHKIAGK